jgi:ubiquinone/menaquinone biosynthesis C-methylase UbiE
VRKCDTAQESSGRRSAGAKGFGRSRYDDVAPAFDQHRALPLGVAGEVRAAVSSVVGAGPHPRLLDLGAGTGRIGRAFVGAGDDYFAVDLSLGMLREFARRAHCAVARLVQADGRALPFPDATFNAVMLIQVFGGLTEWPAVIEEARRVLRRDGVLMLGRIHAPEEGIDARMKRHLAGLLNEQSSRRKENVREGVEQWLEAHASDVSRIIAAAWPAQRTPRGFLDRHRTGARFAALPEAVKDEALARLGEWAHAEFGSLDARFEERHEFELRVFRF